MAEHTGTLEPGEFIIVQNVFKRITQDAWFGGDSNKLDWVGRFVLNAYQGGITDDDRLYQHCLAATRSVEGVSDFYPL